MGALESNTTLIYGIHIRESANDGSDFSNAASDYRVLFLGEDGLLHLKDSAGTVTTPSSAAATAAHACKATRDTSDQSMGNNTFTAVQWNATDIFDTDSMHDPSSSNTRITIPSISGVTTGLWQFNCYGYTTATSPRSDLKFRVDGTTDQEIILGPSTPSAASQFQGTTLIVLSAAQYVEAMVRTTAGTFSVVGTDAAAQPIFEAVFLGKVT